MDIIDEFQRINATEAMIDGWIACKDQWTAVFEKLKAMGIDYREAQCFAEVNGAIRYADGPVGMVDALLYWCATAYDRLEDYEDEFG